jgi:hypothetical protein
VPAAPPGGLEIMVGIDHRCNQRQDRMPLCKSIHAQGSELSAIMFSKIQETLQTPFFEIIWIQMISNIRNVRNHLDPDGFKLIST